MSKKITIEKAQSNGIAIGKVHIIRKPDLIPAVYKVTEVQKELERLTNAFEITKKELSELVEQSDVFSGHLSLAEDVTLLECITTKIKDDNLNAEQALYDTITSFCEMFKAMDDEYMRERGADIKDVGKRIMSHLKGIDLNPFENINEKVILLSEEFTPSDTAKMNFNYVIGFISETGGITSHVSIIARSLDVPALVGVNNAMSIIKDNDLLILDAENGIIIINPTMDELEKYKEKLLNIEKKKRILKREITYPAITKDSKRVKLYANIGNIQDLKAALEYNIDGVGLFRTEFLYMDKDHFPTEEEQFKVYKEAAQLCKGDLTIRTLDIGGDKLLSYFEFEHEDNPYLGCRAIRLCLHHKDIFKVQLRAILRASCYGMIRIMYPMIVSMDELYMANAILEECKNELHNEGISFNKDIKVGMMIETPASVMNAEAFASKVDFFSIGTNDLTQYILAVDRGNKKISNLYNPYNPAVLKSIHYVIKAGRKYNIEVCMCGELASDEKATKLLLGMGLEEFSMTASKIPVVKYIIRKLAYSNAKDFAKKILELSTVKQVEDKMIGKEITPIHK